MRVTENINQLRKINYTWNKSLQPLSASDQFASQRVQKKRRALFDLKKINK